ncbi:hypothetical protein [Bathymodiolus japonicus methanotrophic gill symbiont]|uniref:hypothetical protein n=1 Tax=Bathymodiolus japonicus methanotrophic gill symbiont TaxID=113269 RepID=UPI001C8D0B82|nr:hypothetical protein [Bathymodiolus japonicus methanotrophic gill symbiont]
MLSLWRTQAAGASPIRCVGERITATGVPEFREVAWRVPVLIVFTLSIDISDISPSIWF